MADDKITRRHFIQQTAAAGAGLIGAGILGVTGARAAQQTPLTAPGVSRIALIRSETVMATESQPRLEKVLEMLDTAVCHVFATDNVQQAWEKVAASDDVVAIKTNCMCILLATSVSLVQGVCTRLMDCGVAAENIIVYEQATGDLLKGGFEPRRSGPGVKYYGVDRDYDEPIVHRSFRDRLGKIITQKASALINMPVLKTHQRAGVTLAMKNHYGSISNPSAYHGPHNNCDPYIADINDIPAIKDKTRLIVCDALRGCWQGGPSPHAADIWVYQGIIVGQDPVACDTIGTGIIDAQREQQGKTPIAGPGQLPAHINTAARIGLGNNDRSRIELLEQTLP